MSTPILHLLAGPNGAGKSTLATRVLQPRTRFLFVNADVIAADRWPGAEVEHGYDASELAAQARAQLIAARRSFITETVFSHPSKIDLMNAALRQGYLVDLHVVMVPVEVTVERVSSRVRNGGHSVPEDKIRQRYDRLWPLVAQARLSADRTIFYDNESDRHPFRVVATYERGHLMGAAKWPAWTPPSLP